MKTTPLMSGYCFYRKDKPLQLFIITFLFVVIACKSKENSQLDDKQFKVGKQIFLKPDSLVCEHLLFGKDTTRQYLLINSDTLHYSVVYTSPGKGVAEYEKYRISINDIDTINTEGKNVLEDEGLNGKQFVKASFNILPVRAGAIIYNAWFADGTIDTSRQNDFSIDFSDKIKAKQVADKLRINYWDWDKPDSVTIKMAQQ